jgi:small subunit ribosomal protein S6
MRGRKSKGGGFIILRKYELLFITHPDYDEDKVSSVIQRYQDVVTRGKGSVKTSDKWGKRRLAYEIDGLKEGLYILMTFDAGREMAAEMDRLMRIDQDVIRHMISRMDRPRRKISPRKPLRETRPEEVRVEARESTPAKVVRETAPESAAPADAGPKAPKAGGTTEPQ